MLIIIVNGNKTVRIDPNAITPAFIDQLFELSR